MRAAVLEPYGGPLSIGTVDPPALESERPVTRRVDDSDRLEAMTGCETNGVEVVTSKSVLEESQA
ncbi:hypothetical protein [Natrinema sp. DC36]|uniref:hypothetical protein n=1 Tax=Natrinema sp. DC36 TaxID=2878680 RepID=UPI001CF05C5B|nr:hypothetical protein [Natrinema sp. DC36]